MDDFQGAISGIANGRVIGWAWRPAQPQVRLGVEIWLGTRLLGHASADGFDQGLQSGGIGDGRHAFQFRPSAIPAVDFPATLFARIVDSDAYLSGSFQISSLEELRLRFGQPSPGAPAALPAPAARPEPPRAQASAPPIAPASAPQPGAALEMTNAQLNRIRDSISQALVERLEAQLTIFRDQIGREIDLLRRDFAALAERLESSPQSVPPVQSPTAAPSLATSAPGGRFQVAEEPAMPTDTPVEPAPKMAETVSDTGSSGDQDEYAGIDSPFQRPAPRIEERPLTQRPRSSFAPLPGQRPISRPLPGRGPRRPV